MTVQMVQRGARGASGTTRTHCPNRFRQETVQPGSRRQGSYCWVSSQSPPPPNLKNQRKVVEDSVPSAG